jgi:hypothetical protein
MDEYKKTHILSVKLSASQLQTAIAAIRAGEIGREPGQSVGEDLAIFMNALAWLEASEGEKRAVYYEAND